VRQTDTARPVILSYLFTLTRRNRVVRMHI
jgi:hypothetical protein